MSVLGFCNAFAYGFIVFIKFGNLSTTNSSYIVLSLTFSLLTFSNSSHIYLRMLLVVLQLIDSVFFFLKFSNFFSTVSNLLILAVYLSSQTLCFISRSSLYVFLKYLPCLPLKYLLSSIVMNKWNIVVMKL